MVDSTTLLNSSTFVKTLGLKKIISLKRQIDFHLIFSSLLVFLHLSFQSTQRFHLLFFHNLYKCWLRYSRNSSSCMDLSTQILLYELSPVLLTFVCKFPYQQSQSKIVLTLQIPLKRQTKESIFLRNSQRFQVQTGTKS